MTVTLLCHSELHGGAAIVTYRLMQALRRVGVDARMLVYTKYSNSPAVADMGRRVERCIKFVAERGLIYLCNGHNRENLFKVSVANTGMNVASHPWVKDADIVHLNWINQGLLSLKGIEKLAAMGKPLVWTMHDMWCMTGICHHAMECGRFTAKCGCCPLLGSSRERDLSHRVWKKKREIYSKVPIQFVAVSSWAARKAAESSLLGGRHVPVIHNAFPIESFTTVPDKDSPLFAPIAGRRRIIFGAARLDDPIKGLDIAIEALNMLFDERPDLANNSGVIFYGNLRNRQALDALRFSHVYMGPVGDPNVIRQLYASSDVVLSTSHYETLPGTLIEGQAAGAIPVTFGQGGQSDIVSHKQNGYIARYPDPKDIVRGIVWALEEARISREQLHNDVDRKFSAHKIASQYIALYESML